MGSFSIWHWLVVLLIVALVFGTKKLRGAGSDLGSAVKNFKESVRDAAADSDSDAKPVASSPSSVTSGKASTEKQRQA